MSQEWMEVELAWAGPEGQSLTILRLATGGTVKDALDMAPTDSLPPNGPDPQWTGRVGVFGQRCELERVLAPGDRLEIYRPLELDAKAARRQRAREARLRSRTPP